MLLQAIATATLVVGAVVAGLLGLGALAMGEYLYGICCLAAAGLAIYIATDIDKRGGPSSSSTKEE